MRRTDSGGCAAPGLPYIMAASSEKTRTKADLRDEAIERFAVSKSAFDFAWIWAIEETGNRRWYEPLPRCAGKQRGRC